MKYNKLGSSGLEVPEVCLGTSKLRRRRDALVIGLPKRPTLPSLVSFPSRIVTRKGSSFSPHIVPFSSDWRLRQVLRRVGAASVTFGEQCSEEESFKLMDIALEHGVNFFDVAEMYPVPPRPETCGLAEKIVGNWLESRGCRDKIILATKVASARQCSSETPTGLPLSSAPWLPGSGS